MFDRPAIIRDDLRHGESKILQHRRAVAGLSIFSTAVLGAVALFQVGILHKLPNPPLSKFDADRVNGSEDAYSQLATPDALLGMASYAVTACLAGAGSEGRWKNARWIPLTLAAKASFDASMAAKLSVKQWTKFRTFSIWSLLVAGATFTALPLTFLEVRRALRK